MVFDFESTHTKLCPECTILRDDLENLHKVFLSPCFVLCQEISKLRENLDGNRDTNNRRDTESGKLKSDDVDEKMKHKELTNIVHRAQSNQKLLTETLTKSFAELETSVNEASQ